MTAITRPILATKAWPTNAAMIADVARLGDERFYIEGTVLDATYGEGNFWTMFKPDHLVTNDHYKPAMRNYDFRHFPPQWENCYDTVVFDPPYKLNGTPALGQKDDRYGVERTVPWQERMALILSGAFECVRVTKPRGYLLVKCQDQVCSGQMRWQTDDVTNMLVNVARKVDRFDFINTPQPQPADRRQVHAQRCTSQLLVFRKNK